MVALVLAGGPLARSAPLADWRYMENTDIAWRAYGRGAFREAQRAARALFVLVYADWCEWCHKFETETLETPMIRDRLEEGYLPVAVDYDAQPALAKQLGVRRVPSVVLITPQGEKLARFFGFLGPEDLADTLDGVRSAWRGGGLPKEPLQEFGNEETCCPLAAPEERAAPK